MQLHVAMKSRHHEIQVWELLASGDNTPCCWHCIAKVIFALWPSDWASSPVESRTESGSNMCVNTHHQSMLMSKFDMKHSHYKNTRWYALKWYIKVFLITYHFRMPQQMLPSNAVGNLIYGPKFNQNSCLVVFYCVLVPFTLAIFL